MSKEDEFHAAVDMLYEAVLDDQLWPRVLTRLADMLNTAQIGICAMDRHDKIYDSIAPRTDPSLHAIYQQYWAFRNPLWALGALRPANQIYRLDNLMPRSEFAATPVYNEWYRPAGFSLAMMGANIDAAAGVSALIAMSNAPGNDQITADQADLFGALLPHIDRAVRMHRELRMRDLDHDTAPNRLDQMDLGVMLVDRSAKVLFANAWARALLDNGNGLALRAGRLQSANGSDCLHRLIASCDRRWGGLQSPGGEIKLRRGKRPHLHIKVLPLRAHGAVAELPWLGFRIPVAMVTVSDPMVVQLLN